ncbi:hypothetical protein GEMRC1_007586 [Eukaryota sp. GEM-RC1]
MESLGKEYDVDGVPYPYGLTVFGGVGTSEQHAFMQQVQKGINDAFVRFVSFRKRHFDFSNAKAGSMGRQLVAFVQGTQSALTKNGRQWMSVQLEERNEYAIGLLVALEERIVSALGALHRINAYDQPGVQDGKLAANEVNSVSRIVESIVSEGKFLSGTALDFVTQFKDAIKSDCVHTVDTILSDMSANYAVDNAYPALSGKFSKVSRQWNGEMFLYTFE